MRSQCVVSNSFIAGKNWYVADGCSTTTLMKKSLRLKLILTRIICNVWWYILQATTSIILTWSDDMSIKAWNWDKFGRSSSVTARSIQESLFIKFYEQTCECLNTLYYIMNLAFDPKGANNSPSTCLDRTVKKKKVSRFIHPNFSMEGVNYFYPVALSSHHRRRQNYHSISCPCA